MENKAQSCAFRTSIGGQALMEGVMMRGPRLQASVCRRADGTLVTQLLPVTLPKDKYPALGWPFIRGIVNFINTMVMGMKALMWSTEQLPEEEQGEPDKLDRWISEHFSSDTAAKLIIGTAVVLGILLSVGLFAVLPTLIGSGINLLLPLRGWRGLVEGLFRIVIFLIYLKLCNGVKDIQRMWRYHGAEHKSIFCYEHGKELTVENARAEKRLHPRCGTSFLFLVILVSILVFSFVRTEGTLARLGMHLLLLLPIVSVSYELIKIAGRYDNLFTRILSWPGKQLQYLTTAEPDDSMLECALEALRLVIPEHKGEDLW